MTETGLEANTEEIHNEFRKAVNSLGKVFAIDQFIYEYLTTINVPTSEIKNGKSGKVEYTLHFAFRNQSQIFQFCQRIVTLSTVKAEWLAVNDLNEVIFI